MILMMCQTMEGQRIAINVDKIAAVRDFDNGKVGIIIDGCNEMFVRYSMIEFLNLLDVVSKGPAVPRAEGGAK